MYHNDITGSMKRAVNGIDHSRNRGIIKGVVKITIKHPLGHPCIEYWLSGDKLGVVLLESEHEDTHVIPEEDSDLSLLADGTRVDLVFYTTH